MINKIMVTGAALAIATGNAWAQSSVTLYGLIDAGINYVNNAATPTGHASSVRYGDGASQNRWGIRGTEDLGGGLRAVFALEDGFNAGTGVIGQGGALFGRLASVGLKKDGIGTLTMGRQYAFSTDWLGANYSIGSQIVASNYAYHINDVDQLAASRIDNSVRFTTDNIAGFTFGALYGFSNAAGAFAGAPASANNAGSSRAYSLGANYKNGPFSIGTTYTSISYPTVAVPAFTVVVANVDTGGNKKLGSFGVGTNYTFGAAEVFALYTNTLLQSVTNTQSRFTNYDIGAKYFITATLSFGGGYTYSNLHGSAQGHWNQVDTALDYALSKSTDLYLVGIYQKAGGQNGGTPVQAEIGDATSFFGVSGAGANNQLALRVGMRHTF